MTRLIALAVLVSVACRWIFGKWPWEYLSARDTRSQAIQTVPQQQRGGHARARRQGENDRGIGQRYAATAPRRVRFGQHGIDAGPAVDEAARE